MRASATVAARNAPETSCFEQPLAVVAEGGRVEGRVGDVEAEEPFEEEVVLKTLAELALRADGVEGHQERALEQVLWRDGRAAALGVHRGKGESSSRRSTSSRIRLIGCFAGTRSSAVTPKSIFACRSVLPRIRVPPD